MELVAWHRFMCPWVWQLGKLNMMLQCVCEQHDATPPYHFMRRMLETQPMVAGEAARPPAVQRFIGGAMVAPASGSLSTPRPMCRAPNPRRVMAVWQASRFRWPSVAMLMN